MANESIKYEMSLNDLVTPKLTSAEKAATQYESTLQKLGDTAMRVGEIIAAAFVVDKVYEFGKEIMHVTAEFEGYSNMVKYASLNTEDAGKNLEFIKKSVNDLHLPIRQAYEGFAEMQAGFYGTGIEGDKLRKVFEGISTASTVLHQTPEQFGHVTFALKEIGELGTVQARQMRMLAFALPGAMQLAAQSMHMNSQQFHEAMHKGEISSNQFLMNFSAKLKEHFESGLANAGNSLIAKMNDTNNRFVELQLEMGEKLKPVFISIMDGIIQAIGVMQKFWEKSVAVFDYLKTNAGTIMKEIKDDAIALAAGITATAIAWGIAYPQSILYAGSLIIDAVATAGLTIATYALTAAQWLLNTAMDANPIGIVVVAIGALTTGLIVAYNHSAKFRAILAGLGEVAKDIGGIFGGLGEQIAGALTFNPALVKKGFEDMAHSFYDIGSAFHRGYSQSMSESNTAEAAASKSKTTAKPTAKPTAGRGATIPEAAESKPTSKVTGAKNTTFNIKIDSLVKSFTVNTNTLKESPEKVKDLLTQVMLSVVNDSQIVAGY